MFYIVSFYIGCYTTTLGKGEGWRLLKRLNMLHLFTPVLSQEPDVQKLWSVNVVPKCFSFDVFHFSYRLESWITLNSKLWNAQKMTSVKPFKQENHECSNLYKKQATRRIDEPHQQTTTTEHQIVTCYKISNLLQQRSRGDFRYFAAKKLALFYTTGKQQLSRTCWINLTFNYLCVKCIYCISDNTVMM